MQCTNFQIDWNAREYQIQVSNSLIIGTSAKRLDFPSTLVEETPLTTQAQTHKQQVKSGEATTWITDEANPNFGWKVLTSLLKA